MATGGTGDRALNEQETSSYIDANNFQALNGALSVAVLPCHTFTREYTTRILRHTDRARRTRRNRVTVRCTVRTEVVATDHTSESTALRSPGHVNGLADAKSFDADHGTRFEVTSFCAEFARH